MQEIPNSPDKNKEYREAVVSEVAQKMKDAGYTLLGSKVLPWLLTITVSLIAVIYVSLKQADSALAQDVQTLKNDRVTLDLRLQNMASNIYLLCKAQKNVECVDPSITK